MPKVKRQGTRTKTSEVECHAVASPGLQKDAKRSCPVRPAYSYCTNCEDSHQDIVALPSSVRFVLIGAK